MKSYNFTTDRLEIRSAVIDNEKQYVVNGYANVKGIDVLNSLFTDKARESMLEQLKTRRVSIDAEHTNTLLNKIEYNTKKIIDKLKNYGSEIGFKGDINFERELAELMEYARNSDIPIAKIFDARLTENGLFVETRLNPAIKNIDPEYFDAVWTSLQKGFLNGLSIEFMPTKTRDEFIDGKYVHCIDDLMIPKIVYTGGAAHHGNRITDVFVRCAAEIKEDFEKMEEKKEEQKVEETKTEEVKVDEEKVNMQKQLEEKNKEIEELKASVEKQKLEEKTVREELEDIKKLLMDKQKDARPTAKGLVAPEDKYNAQQNVEKKDKIELDGLSMSDLLKRQDEELLNIIKR